MQDIINIILSYLVGSISGSLFLGKLKGIDIRSMGSGNAGGTNAFRTVGPLFAFSVIIVDVLKGIMAVLFIYKLNFINILFPSLPNLHFTWPELTRIMCAVSAVLGHVYPVYYNFKGGKGAGTLIGIVSVLFPQCILYALLSWLIVLIFTGYVGLGTIVSGIMLAISAYVLKVNIIYFYFALSMSLFIIFTHRSNIVRMIQGKENQFKKIMIFKK